MYVETFETGGKPEKWNFWWHSHVEMDTGFSSIDDDTLNKITKNGGKLVALCTNKFGHYNATFYVDGKRVVKNLTMCVIPTITKKELAEAEQIYNEKVTEIVIKQRKFITDVDDTDHIRRYYNG